MVGPLKYDLNNFNQGNAVLLNYEWFYRLVILTAYG